MKTILATATAHVSLDAQDYLIDPNTVKLAEPNRYLCRAWKFNHRGKLREVLNIATLDRLGRKWAGAMK